MTVHNDFTLQCERRNLTMDREKASLLYELIANNPRALSRYGLGKGHAFSQFWLYSKVTPSAVLLQATKNKNGSIELCMQGLRNVVPGLPNFLDFFNKDEQDTFLKYLPLF